MTVIALPIHRQRHATPADEPAQRPLSPQILFREVNEELVARLGDRAGDELELVCECDRQSCSRAIHVSRADYERVRRFPTRFVLARGHSSLEDERIVELREGFAVVEKTGPAARVAIRLDPRRHDRPDDAA